MKQVLDDLERFKRNELVDGTGLGFLEYQKTLTPRYAVVWRDILAGWVAIGLIAYALCRWQLAHPGLGECLVAILVAGALIGFGQLYLHNFFHEAAHYNLAADRRVNDLLANLFLGAVVGLDIAVYRLIHFDHHRHLGTPQDTEHSYFFPLNWRFVLSAVSGYSALRVMLTRNRRVRAERPDSGGRGWLLLGVGLNATLLLSAWLAGFWTLSVAWTLAMLSFFPFFNTLRNLVEHRAEDADPTADYFKIAHGVVNRLFGDGPVASTFGSAGFNRHLLHHWAPQISYTRLRELEDYLMQTAMGPSLDQHRCTYLATINRLWS